MLVITNKSFHVRWQKLVYYYASSIFYLCFTYVNGNNTLQKLTSINLDLFSFNFSQTL